MSNTSAVVVMANSWRWLLEQEKKAKEKKVSEAKQVNDATDINSPFVITQPFTPSMQPMDSFQRCNPPQSILPVAVVPQSGYQSPRFGSLISLVATTTGSWFLNEGLNAVLKDIDSLNAPKLKQSVSFAKAKSRLEIAKSVSGNEQQEYVREAERKFVDAASEVDLHYFKAECYQYAAICAKMGGRTQQTINAYADLGLHHYQEARKEFDAIEMSVRRRTSRDGYNIKSLLLTPLYLLSLPVFMLEDSTAEKKIEQFLYRAAGGHIADDADKLLDLILKCKGSDLPEVCRKLKR